MFVSNEHEVGAAQATGERDGGQDASRVALRDDDGTGSAGHALPEGLSPPAGGSSSPEDVGAPRRRAPWIVKPAMTIAWGDHHCV